MFRSFNQGRASGARDYRSGSHNHGGGDRARGLQRQQQQQHRQRLTKKQRTAQTFLEQTRDTMTVIRDYMHAVASDSREAKTQNMLATSSLNLMKDSVQSLRGDGHEDILQMGLAEVRAAALQIRSEQRDLLASSEGAGLAFEHCFGYLEAALSGEEVPTLPASANVPKTEAAWNAVFGRVLSAGHEMEQFQRKLDEEPEKFQQQQARLLAAAGELPPQTSGFDISVLTRHYESARPIAGRSNEENDGEGDRDVEMSDSHFRGDGFDWIRRLELGAPLQVRDDSGRVLNCSAIGCGPDGILRVFLTKYRKEVEVAFSQVVEPFAAPRLG